MLNQIIIYFKGINVQANGTYLLGQVTHQNPALKFHCQGGGAIKAIGTWTQQPIVRIGYNATSYNNIMQNQNLAIQDYYGRCVSQPNVRVINNGTNIYTVVTQSGVVDQGTPLVDYFLFGYWDISQNV